MPNEIQKADSTGWKIGRLGSDGAFMLTHPGYEAITDIVSFDEACRLRDAMRTGKFISFIRGYETFLMGIRKRTA